MADIMNNTFVWHLATALVKLADKYLSCLEDNWSKGFVRLFALPVVYSEIMKICSDRRS